MSNANFGIPLTDHFVTKCVHHDLSPYRGMKSSPIAIMHYKVRQNMDLQIKNIASFKMLQDA